jgi:hypothetical protein
MTNAERLALARNKLARLEMSRRLAWDAGEEDQVCNIDADIAATSARIVELEAGQ